jgi:hypothetical protein
MYDRWVRVGRRGAVSVVVAVAGCFSPAPAANLPCAPDNGGPRCPGGLVCTVVGGVELCVDPVSSDASPPGDAPPDARVDGSPDVDSDLDGIDDSLDNCPSVGNPQQWDEDTDGLGDDCDRCPAFADAADPDADGDGVGDRCDPHAGTSGEQIFLFEGFHEGIPATWRLFGSFSSDADDALGTAVAGGHSTLRIPVSPVGEEMIASSATLIDKVGNGMRSVGVVLRHQQNSDMAIECRVFQPPASPFTRYGIYDTSTSTVVADDSHGFAIGETYAMIETRSGTDYNCRVTNADAELVGSAPLTASSPEVGLRIESATARFHWVLVVTTP